jgi:WASH complex subunit strumpellin
MIRIVQIKSDLISHISLISDITYSWESLWDYLPDMQRKVKKHPQVAKLLKPTFVKLSCILNFPMQRII